MSIKYKDESYFFVVSYREKTLSEFYTKLFESYHLASDINKGRLLVPFPFLEEVYTIWFHNLDKQISTLKKEREERNTSS